MRTQAQACKIHLATRHRIRLKLCGGQGQGIEGYRSESMGVRGQGEGRDLCQPSACCRVGFKIAG